MGYDIWEFIFPLLLFVVGDSTLKTSMQVTCKCGNLFFPYFYGLLVTVLCRFGNLFFLTSLCGRYSCLKLKRMLKHPILYENLCFLSVAYEFIFPLLYVVKDVGTSNVWELTFPKCSIGIYFSSALCGEGCWNIHCMGTYVS